MYKHIAYDLYTGEIISCTTGNTLKKQVKKAVAIDHNKLKWHSKWIFCHSGREIDIITKLNTEKNLFYSRLTDIKLEL